MANMKAAQITDYTQVRDIRIMEAARPPEPTAGQVLVRVAAAGLNPIDWKTAEGELKRFMNLPFPFIPGSDFCGTVESVGPDVQNLRPGQEVYGMAGFNRGGTGSLAELAVTKAAFVWARPKGLTPEECAAIPMAGLRAWHVLVECLKVGAGTRVFIQGGAGGIGTFAIQIAKELGAHVATTASAKDLDYVRSLGADVAKDYARADALTDLHDFDAVFDLVGGAPFASSFNVLRRGGKITTMLWERHPELEEKLGVTFINQKESTTPASFVGLGALLESGAVKPQVDKVFPFGQTGEALHYLKAEHPRGKVVVKVL